MQDAKQYYSGVITNECSWWEEMDAWGAAVNDPRFPSKLYFSVYDYYNTFTEKVDLGVQYFGNKFRIGEWGAKMNLAGQELSTYGEDHFLDRMNYLISKNVTEAYTFDYKELDSSSSEMSFGLWNSVTDQTKPSWNLLLNYMNS